MRRLLACLLLLAACSSGGGERAFLDTWKNDGFEDATVEGQPALVDTAQRVLYIEQCATAKRVTATGGAYGGNAYVCKTSTRDYDPYDTYLANNPDPSHVISREDAQTRALLGCKTQWAPGTIDYVLHEAYKKLC